MTKPHFKPFPEVGSKYGAPMGRRSHQLDSELTADQLGVAGPAGEYDAGGAYWGTSSREGPVWAVWHKGHGNDGVAYVRAFSREAAKRKALEA